MAVYTVGAVWDDRRNTSRVVPVSPNAWKECREACERWARDNPAHFRWLLDGHPTMTHAEHVERFGEPYVSHRGNRGVV
jgi:hypothetical protein